MFTFGRLLLRIVCGVLSLVFLAGIVMLGLEEGFFAWPLLILAVLFGYLAIFGAPDPVRIDF